MISEKLENSYCFLMKILLPTASTAGILPAVVTW